MRSRFEGEEGGVERFLEVTRRLGFDTRQMDRTNKMFLLAEFKKSKRKPESGIEFEAKVRTIEPHRNRVVMLADVMMSDRNTL